MNSILRLQRTVGNRVVQRHVQAPSTNADRLPSDIQLSSLKDFTGKPQRQAFLIDDADIEATDEFKKYMNAGLVWQTKDKMTRQEAFLACRLIIEAI